MKILCVALITIFFGFSCASKNSNVELSTEIKSVTIPLDSDYLSSYQVLSAYDNEGTNNLIGYNGTRHSLDYFDLDNAKVLKTINLEREGPNAIGSLESIYWHNSDSIFVYERGKVKILNEAGHFFSSLDLYELFEGKNLGEPVCNFYFKLNYLEKEKLIFFSLIHHGVSLEERASLPLVASLNIETLEVKALPIIHTTHYEKVRGNVGFITYLGFQDFMKDRMVFNFQYESSLFSLDFSNQEKKQSGSHEEKFTPELFDLDNIAIDNPHFLTPIPDNHRSLIYRGIWDSPDQSLPEAGFTEKKISIGVFDSDLNFISNYSLPNYTYQINNWFVNENGLYLNVAHPRNEKVSEEFLVFDVFQFDKLNEEK